MKHWLAAVAAVTFVCAASPAFSQDDLAAAPRISLQDTKKGVDTRTVVVVDVRDPVSFASGHIPGARLVPLADIAGQAAALKAANKPVITYCA